MSIVSSARVSSAIAGIGCKPSSHQPGRLRLEAPSRLRTAAAWAPEQSLGRLGLAVQRWSLTEPLLETLMSLLLTLQGDCSWFNSCNLAALRSDVPGFVSAARTA